ncbi:MAG: EF-hand domain-containing protein [Betaproteobacteria bacterium]
MHARQVLTALVGAAALLTPYLAAAKEERGARMEEHFRKADTNNDGGLTREEAKAMPRVAKNFDAIDADKSGTVTLAEMQATTKKMAKEMHKRGEERFKAADANADGMLDREEAKAMPRVEQNFDAIDANKSGTVTGKEIHVYMSAHRQEHRKD